MHLKQLSSKQEHDGKSIGDAQKMTDHLYSSLLKITINSSKLHKLARIKNLSTKWPYKTNNFQEKYRGVCFSH